MEYPSLDKPKAGAIRFNTDSSQMEIYDGNQWTGILATSPELQTGGTRGLIFGGEGSNPRNTIQFFNVDTTGNASDFGDMNDERTEGMACASRVRAFAVGGFLGGQPTNYTNTLDMVTIASTGNATNFADSAEKKGQGASCASATRGINFAGVNAGVTLNTIDFFTMSSQADGLDFGDISITSRGVAACSSPTRGISFLGDNAGSTKVNTIEFVTISTTGNSSDFGDSTTTARYSSGCSNAVRGLKFGGNDGSATDVIDFITIATLGNAKDFGNLLAATSDFGGTGFASPTRGVVAGGGGIATIQFVQIMTTGNSVDFGDLTAGNQYGAGASNGHGGL